MAARNPQNAFALTPPVSQNGRRQSRFTEHPMQEYTPANSVYEEELEYGEDDDLSDGRVFLRLVNAIGHSAGVHDLAGDHGAVSAYLPGATSDS